MSVKRLAKGYAARFAPKVRPMKKGIAAIIFLLSVSLLPANAATPPKAGSVCTKSGTTKIYMGKKFTCIKVGKKLVWDKGGQI